MSFRLPETPAASVPTPPADTAELFFDDATDPGILKIKKDDGSVVTIELTAGVDADAIHDNVAGEITLIAEKVAPVSADLIIIEDSEDGDAKKKVQVGNLPGGSFTEVNDLENDGVLGIADDQVAVGSAADTVEYKTLPDGAVAYDTATNTFAQASSADLSDGPFAALALDDLTDVTLTAPATGAVLVKSAGDWVDGQVDLADPDAVTGVLPKANMAATTVHNDQANAYSAGSQDFQAASAVHLKDSTLEIHDETAPTKIAKFQCSGLTAGVTKTMTIPDEDGTLVLLDAAQALENKVIDADINFISNIDAGELKDDAVTFAKMQELGANKLIGSVSAGNPVEVDCTAAGRALIDDASASDQRTTLGLGSLATLSSLALTDLSDVTLTSPATGGVLIKSAGDWIDGQVDLADSDAITGTLPVGNGGTGITALGTGVATFLGTPSSANLAAALTDETGSGAAVFGTGPTINGSTLTGVHDAGGATSFELPNGAGGTTVDATGEACVDSTSRTLNFYDGTAEVVLNPVIGKSFFLEAPVAADDLPIYRFDVAATLVKVVYAITGGTNWVGQLQEADDAQGTGAADTQAADSTVTGNTTVTSFSNASFDAGDYVRLKTTSVSGSVTWLHVTLYYRENP